VVGKDFWLSTRRRRRRRRRSFRGIKQPTDKADQFDARSIMAALKVSAYMAL
jgi:hypothetical protein